MFECDSHRSGDGRRSKRRDGGSWTDAPVRASLARGPDGKRRCRDPNSSLRTAVSGRAPRRGPRDPLSAPDSAVG